MILGLSWLPRSTVSVSTHGFDEPLGAGDLRCFGGLEGGATAEAGGSAVDGSGAGAEGSVAGTGTATGSGAGEHDSINRITIIARRIAVLSLCQNGTDPARACRS
jgi:hypothetical protein